MDEVGIYAPDPMALGKFVLVGSTDGRYDWDCTYCRLHVEGKNYQCPNCGAQRFKKPQKHAR